MITRRRRHGGVGLRPVRRDVRLVLGAARLRADPHRLRLPAPAGAGHRAPRRHVDGVLRHQPPQPRGPRDHAHDRRAHGRVRGGREPPPRHPARLGRPSRARCTSASAAVAIRRCTPTCPTSQIGKAVRLRDGSDVAIITTGSEVHPALQAADALAADGVEVARRRHAHREAARPSTPSRPRAATGASSPSRSTTGPAASARRSPRRCWRAASQACGSAASTFPTSTCRSARPPPCTPTTTSTPTGSRPGSGPSSTINRELPVSARRAQGAVATGIGSTRSVPVWPACL